MSRPPLFAFLLSLVYGCACGCATVSPRPPGIMLGDLTWQQAESVLTPDTVVVIPLGAGSKEHGPHLLLKNDAILAAHFTRRLQERTPVVIAPTINYSYYPAFVDYPGSTTLRLETARDLIIDIVRSLAHHGPRRFYVLNTGVSTTKALAPAKEALQVEGILLSYTDLLKLLSPVEKRICRQEGGTHADESETSMLLYLQPGAVDMSKAVKDYYAGGKGKFQRTQSGGGEGRFTPSGIWGDPTLATVDKGQKLVEALVDGLVRDVEQLRKAPLPPVTPPSASSSEGAAPQQPAPVQSGKPD